MSKQAADSTREAVEQAVLDVYQQVNPSTYNIETEPKEFERREQIYTSLFRDRLHFPPKMFADADVLDFGSGTGEHAVFYARWGARCTLVEMNELAIERSKKIFSLFAPEAKPAFNHASLFNFTTDQRFDIVISNAVLHHTAAKREGFEQLVSYLKPGGYVMLGIGTAAGMWQRNIQRLILYALAQTPAEISALAEYFFSNHIHRAVEFGRRSREAVIYDTYINPKIDLPTVAEVLTWFRDTNIRLYSAWPTLTTVPLGDSHNHALFEPSSVTGAMAITELAWLLHNRNDVDVVPEWLAPQHDLHHALEEVAGQLHDITPRQQPPLPEVIQAVKRLRGSVATTQLHEPLLRTAHEFFQEIQTLLEAVESRNKETVKNVIDQSHYIFRGSAGVGLNFFVGFRP